MPAHCQIDHRHIDERYRHLAINLDDVQAVDDVGTAPQGQVYIGNVPSVIPHVGELVVQVITYDVGQGDMQGNQDNNDSGNGPQWPAIATFHGGGLGVP